jgi:hypothetical protein
MAQNKKKKKTVQVLQISPKRYLMEAARKIPMDKVFSDYGYSGSGLVQFVVTRKRPNGTFLMGMYLVDMFCLGLKSTGFRQTMTQYELDDFVKTMEQHSRMKFNAVDPNLAFNIIYGAIEYAEDLGFDIMDKDFEHTEYILPPVESIEYVDVEFGQDGKPFYFSGPYDNVGKNLAILNKSVGEGNYIYVANIEGGADFDDDDFDDDDDDDDKIEPSPMIGLDLRFEDDNTDLRDDKTLMPGLKAPNTTVSMNEITFEEVYEFEQRILAAITYVSEIYYDKTSYFNLYMTILGGGNLEKHKSKLLKSFFKTDEDDDDISIDYELQYSTFLPHFSILKDFKPLHDLIQNSVMLKYLDALLARLHKHPLNDTHIVTPFIAYGDKDDFDETEDHISIGINIKAR